MRRGTDLIVGLDVGTAKVAAAIGEWTATGLALRGAGYAPSNGGLSRGVVVDLDATAEAIRQAVREAELRAGVQVHSAFVTVGGDHIRGLDSHGVLRLATREVRAADVAHVLDVAETVALPEEYEVLQVVLRDFVLDGQEGIPAPVGMKGVRLEARAHVLAARSAALRNVCDAVERAEVRVAGVFWSGWAAAEAVLAPEEKQLGVAVLDLGAGTTNFLVYYGGALRFTGALRYAGNHVTSDIAAALETPLPAAEHLKREWGLARAEMADGGEVVEVPGFASRPPRRVERKWLCAVIQARVEEIFELAWQELQKSGLTHLLRAGLVLTGGGTLLPGIERAARHVTGQSLVRIGSAVGTLPEEEREEHAGFFEDPAYTAVLGLLRHGASQGAHSDGAARSRGVVGRGWQRLRGYLAALFE